ncbi:MAG: hypothetical protein VXY77_04510 [Pseudomonadota bacterium]|nr:hypothetical protein [Pseudomonadota bacterium]
MVVFFIMLKKLVKLRYISQPIQARTTIASLTIILWITLPCHSKLGPLSASFSYSISDLLTYRYHTVQSQLILSELAALDHDWHLLLNKQLTVLNHAQQQLKHIREVAQSAKTGLVISHHALSRASPTQRWLINRCEGLIQTCSEPHGRFHYKQYLNKIEMLHQLLTQKVFDLLSGTGAAYDYFYVMMKQPQMLVAERHRVQSELILVDLFKRHHEQDLALSKALTAWKRAGFTKVKDTYAISPLLKAQTDMNHFCYTLKPGIVVDSGYTQGLGYRVLIRSEDEGVLMIYQSIGQPLVSKGELVAAYQPIALPLSDRLQFDVLRVRL